MADFHFAVPQRLAMLRSNTLLLAFGLLTSALVACFSNPAKNCRPGPPVNTSAVEGSWNISLLTEDSLSTLTVSSMFFVRISRAPETNGGTADVCSSPTEAALDIAYLESDDRFKDAQLSGVFTPSSPGAADGSLHLELGDLSIDAVIRADATVTLSSGLTRSDGGTAPILVDLVRTSI
jgi:hypothetical protein